MASPSDTNSCHSSMNEELSEKLILVYEHSGHTLLPTWTSIFQLIIFRVKEMEGVKEIKYDFFSPRTGKYNLNKREL